MGSAAIPRTRIQNAQAEVLAEPFSSARSRFPSNTVGVGLSSGSFINMETAGPGPGPSSSRLEAPGSTDDPLFLVKGVVG